MSSRNVEKDGVLINIYFFCKAVGIRKPERVDDPVTYMESIVEDRKLDWKAIAEKVKTYRDDYKSKRRLNHHRKAGEHKKTEEEFFAQFSRVTAKERKCLRCDSVFLSKIGERMCNRCNYVINNYLGSDGT